MSADAVDSPSIAMVRWAVPEFERTFLDLVEEEEGELGAFQAMSAFAAWVLARLDNDIGDEAARRGFEAVERLIDSETAQLGDQLAAEFIEATQHDQRALALMGERTRARAYG